MILHCPICHASFTLEALIQDQAGRELMALLASKGSGPLLSYLSLFRSEKRALSFDRALKLAKEALQLSADPAQLDAAMAETVESMRVKREQGQGKPLKNHNYLKRVLESTPAGGAVAAPTRERAAAGTSKRAQTLEALATWAGTDWLRIEIANGLQALVALSLENTPAADTIGRTADIWQHVLSKHNTLDIEEIDAPRVRQAFSALLSKTGGRWPEPSTLKDLMPKRPQRRAVDYIESDEARERGREAAKALKAAVGVK